ncbi:MAG: mannose-6-phosphate isomerase, class I, partial [bacterium]|nr:mannose-6-phosphate isomerase, class I [bacterium]
MSTPGILSGAIQSYAWGSREALPRIMGVAPTGEPQAELWLGAHPRGPAVLRRGGAEEPLHQVIAADPVGELGVHTAEQHGGELPFLLKILAVAQPLSLQAHPDRRQAQAGFDAEQQQGIPVDADHRTFRDRNHKPELICALEPFTALCGFRPPSTAAALLDSLAVPGLAPAVESLRAGRTQQALRWLLRLPRRAGTEMARQAAAACRRPGPHTEERRWAVRIAQQHPGDIGVVIALLLNLVQLEAGQA